MKNLLVQGRVFLMALMAGIFLGGLAEAASESVWPKPFTRDFYSENREYRFHVIPATKGRPCMTRLYKGDPNKNWAQSIASAVTRNQSYVLLWETELPHAIAPLSAVVSNSGRIVAVMDGWGGKVPGDRVLMLLGKKGAVTTSFPLFEILTPDEIAAHVPRHSSAHWWRAGDAWFDESEEELYLPTRAGGRVLRLADRKILNPEAGYVRWPNHSDTAASYRRLLAVYKEARGLQSSTDRRRARDERRSLEALVQEADSIVMKLAPTVKRKDRRLLDAKALRLLLDAARWFDTEYFRVLQKEEYQRRIMVARMQADMYVMALENFNLNNGRYPSTEEGLEILTVRTKGGPYIDRSSAGLTDPWSMPWTYEFSLTEGQYFLTSAGPDGIPGTDDDVKPRRGR